jgi:predicted HTH domain antitoxin
MDDDDGVDALRRMLHSTQKLKCAVRLSERNVVEVLAELRRRGVIEDDEAVMHTMDGREFVTRERLREEIMEAVRGNAGRATFVDLQTALNVDVAHCEREAKVLVGRGVGNIKLLEGELMVPELFDDIASEVNELLLEMGSVSMPDVARKFSLSINLMEKILRERMGTDVHGLVAGSMIYTTKYVEYLTSRVRGALLGCLLPTSKESLLNAAFGESLEVASAQLVGSILNELVKSNKAKGSMVGGVWYPEIYERGQRRALQEAFERTGVVTPQDALRIGLDERAMKEMLGQLDCEYLSFDTFTVAKRVLDQLEIAIMEAMSEDGYLQIDNVLPDALDARDSQKLLLASSQSSAFKTIGKYIVSEILLRQCNEAAENFARKIAQDSIMNTGTLPVCPFSVVELNVSVLRQAMRHLMPNAGDDIVEDLVRRNLSTAIRTLDNFDDNDEVNIAQMVAVKKFEELYPTAQLYAKDTTEVLPLDYHAHKYVCQRFVLPCADVLLQSVLCNFRTASDMPLSDSVRLKAVECLTADLRPMGDSLLLAVRSGESPNEIMERTCALAKALGVPTRETPAKSILHEHMEGLKAELRDETELPKALLIALPYLVAKTRRKLVGITGRSLEAALNACAGLEPERINVVTHIIRQVIAELTGAVSEKRFTLEDLKRAVLVED